LKIAVLLITTNLLFTTLLFPIKPVFYRPMKRMVISNNTIISRGRNASSPIISIHSTYSTEEIDLLARVAYAEARSEGIEGMLAVVNVVLNRVKDKRFPNSIKEVIYQKGQFASVYNGSINNQPNAEAYEAVQKALNGENIVADAIFFWQPNEVKNAKKVIGYKEIVTKIGNHQFAK